MLKRGRPKVLLIDDDPIVLKFLSRTLRDDVMVTAASDGHAGYDLLCDHRPDVVVLDILMPTMDGWRLLHKSEPITWYHESR